MNTISNATLHGTWIKQPSDETGWFLFWGEQGFPENLKKPKGRKPKILSHLYAVSSEGLREMLINLSESLTLDGFKSDIMDGEAVLSLPVVGKIPLPSRRSVIELEGEPEIYPCKVNAVYLSTPDALLLLSSIPLDAYALPCKIGTSVRFWSTTAKFVLHLILKQKFIPMLRQEEQERFFAFWEPVLDEQSEIERLEKSTRMMPDACRCVKSALINMPKGENKFELSEPHPEQLILSFLSEGIDKWVRSHIGQTLIKNIPKSLKDEAITSWFRALTETNGRFEAPDLEGELRELCKSLSEWSKAGKTEEGKFRVCFRLEPPEIEAGGENTNWTLRYFLQAVDDLSLLVPVDVVWKERTSTLRYLNREFESPQERLLKGLGMAAKMFPPIEGSLRQARPESCSLNVQQAYQFLSEASVLLGQSGFGVLAPPWWMEKKSQIKARVKLSSPRGKGPGFFSLNTIVKYDWQLALGDETITPEELEHLAKLKVPLVKMRGEWVMLRPEDIKSAIEFLKRYGETKEMSLRDAIQLNLSDTPELEGIQVSQIESSGRLESLLIDLKKGSKRRLRQPKEFVGKLRPYQLRGLSWLDFMRQCGLGGCLADDMGLGKTIQVIALLLREQKAKGNGSRPNLLICPTSVVGNWSREVSRFAPSLKVMVHHGGDRASGEEFAKSIMEFDLVVTSYGLALRDANDLRAIDWKGLILDEAQNIKNPSSKTAQSVRSLKAEYKFALTGTPIENRLIELWSIMEFLNPKYLGSQKGFQERFVLPIERYGDEETTKDLKSIVAPFILRRLKTDPKVISDLPEKLEMKIYCNLSREQVTLYEATVKNMMQQFEAAEEEDETNGMKRRGMILAGLTTLKQLCNHPALLLKDQSEIEGRSGKLQRLVEMLEEALSEGDKALIFTQFTKMGEMLREYIERKFRRDVLFLHGGVPQKKRDKMVSLFQEGQNGPPIFVISVRAGGTGLNLTNANHVFHFDRWWNPAVEDQATDRAFRIGQTRSVQVHKFICAGTLEERIDELIERKKTLTNSIIGAGENWLTELSTEELRNMITLRRDEALVE